MTAPPDDFQCLLIKILLDLSLTRRVCFPMIPSYSQRLKLTKFTPNFTRKVIILLQSELAETTLRLGDAKDQVRMRVKGQD